MATMDKKVLISISEEELSTGESTPKRLPSKAGNIFVYCYRNGFSVFSFLQIHSSVINTVSRSLSVNKLFRYSIHIYSVSEL